MKGKYFKVGKKQNQLNNVLNVLNLDILTHNLITMSNNNSWITSFF